MNPYPRTWLEIDLPALAHNLSLIRSTVGPGRLVALVAKADAYGHGLIPICRFALQKGADWIAVATVQEGIALRDAGVDAPVLVLSPILPVEAEQAVFYRLRLMVEGLEVARTVSEAAQAQRTSAVLHLAVDTGLSRFGCLPEEAAEIALSISSLPGVVIEGIGSHFADSGHDPGRTQVQARLFEESVERCLAAGVRFKIRHLANSAGAFRYPGSRHELVRVGIAAYGVDPYGLLPAPDAANGPLSPILAWKARVMSVRRRPAGTLVSYSGTYKTTRSTTIATLGVGYGDGYPRSLSNKGFASVRGVRVPVIGLVCMDQVLVDATDVPGVEPGDEAVLIGPEVPVVDLAVRAGTNTHEIVTRIMSRVPRRYRFV